MSMGLPDARAKIVGRDRVRGTLDDIVSYTGEIWKMNGWDFPRIGRSN